MLCHDFLPPLRICSHVKLDYVSTIAQHSLPCPFMSYLHHVFRSLAVFSLSKPRHVMSPHQVICHSCSGGWSETSTETKQTCLDNFQSLSYAPGFTLLSCASQGYPHAIHPTYPPSILLHLTSAISTRVAIRFTPIIILISTLSDPLYSPSCFLFLLF